MGRGEEERVQSTYLAPTTWNKVPPSYGSVPTCHGHASCCTLRRYLTIARGPQDGTAPCCTFVHRMACGLDYTTPNVRVQTSNDATISLDPTSDFASLCQFQFQLQLQLRACLSSVVSFAPVCFAFAFDSVHPALFDLLPTSQSPKYNYNNIPLFFGALQLLQPTESRPSLRDDAREPSTHLASFTFTRTI